MKILFIYQYCILGGVTTQLVNRLKGFEQNFECHFMFLQDYGGLIAFENYMNVYILNSKLDFLNLIQENKYDIISVIDTNIIYDWLEGIMYDGLIINEVHTTTSNLDKINELKEKVPMDIIVTPSEYMKDIIENKYNFKHIVPVQVLTNCLDFEKFKYIYTESKSEKIPILWVGKLDNHKLIFDFINLATILQSKYSEYNFEYIIVGGVTAPYKTIDTFIESLIENNLLNNTRWFSSIAYEDMYKIYSLVKQNKGVYVSTTSNESFGMTILEAMALGLPIVAPDVGALCELPYENDESLYEPRNLEMACELIIKQIGKNYRYNINQYEPYKIREQFIKIIQNLNGLS